MFHYLSAAERGEAAGEGVPPPWLNPPSPLSFPLTSCLLITFSYPEDTEGALQSVV